MTTYTFSGFRITTTSGTPSAFQASSMTWSTSENFRFQYNFDAATAGAFSSITTDLPSSSKLHAAVVNGALRVNLDAVASIGEWTWGGGNKTTVMAIQTASNQIHYYAMKGAALPVMTTLAQYNSFLSSVTATTSLISGVTVFGPRGPLQVVHDMEDALSRTGTSQNDVIVGLDGIDNWTTTTLNLGLGSDSFTGTSAADWVLGGDSSDTLNGNAGNDTLSGQDGHDLVQGGAGNDSLHGGDGSDSVYGGDDNDIVNGSGGNDLLYGGNGTDNMIGGVGNDLIHGDAGNDTVAAGNNNDTVYGGDGDDSLNGDSGTDLVFGEGGNDTVMGSKGNDTLYGGDGNDSMDGGSEDDQVFGGNGNDVVKGGSGNDTLLGGLENDTLNGGSGNDILIGEEGDDLLDGSSGNDSLAGAAGTDELRGGLGNDTLNGGEGSDALYGGGQTDAFVFAGTVGADVIWDFSSADGDRLAFEDAFGANAAAIFALATQEGNHVEFDLGAAGTVTVRNTTLALVEDLITVFDGTFLG